MRSLTLFILWAAHAFDAVFTAHILLAVGPDGEWNPLLAKLWELDSWSFFVMKFTLLTIVSMAGFHYWSDRRMKNTMVLLTLGSVILVGYELRHWGDL